MFYCSVYRVFTTYVDGWMLVWVCVCVWVGGGCFDGVQCILSDDAGEGGRGGGGCEPRWTAGHWRLYGPLETSGRNTGLGLGWCSTHRSDQGVTPRLRHCSGTALRPPHCGSPGLLKVPSF